MDQSVTFCSHGQVMKANLNIPSPKAPCIIISHGLEGSKDGEKWRKFTPKLASQGFACLRFNYRGCGTDKEKSDGDFIDTTLTGRIQDFSSAIDFAQTCDIDNERIGVIGSSLGGTTFIAAKDRRIKAAAILSTPCRFKMPSNEELNIFNKRGFYELPSGRRLLPTFFEDFDKYDIPKDAREIRCPLLVLHGSNDELVASDNAYDIYSNSREPKRLEIIAGANHGFDDPIHQKEVISITINWFHQYLW